MDLTSTITPDSTQLNADDMISGPATVTIASVSKGNAEQPVNIHLQETPDRAYRPSKSMRRVLVACWGPDASQYVGRKMTLYRDPEVTFGREKVGGIKISHLSHIDKRRTLPLTVSRGKRSAHVVEPLPTDAPTAAPEPTVEQIAQCTDPDMLRAWWKSSGAERRAQIEARVAELDQPQQEPQDAPEAGGSDE